MITYSMVLWCSLLPVAANQNAGDDVPRKIRELAAPKSEKAFSNAEDRDRYIEGFANGFKTGLISPEATVTFSSNSNEDAYVAGAEEGRKTALTQPKEGADRITLLDFGYTKIKAKGSVRMEFEQWEFRPVGKKEVWWFSLVADGQDPDSALRKKHNVTLDGFLSPKKEIGGYGHMGAYEREFVGIKSKKNKSGKDKSGK